MLCLKCKSDPISLSRKPTDTVIYATFSNTKNSSLDWRLYAIYRLEHWGLSSINNSDVNDSEILEANRIYGSLGELAVMVMPQAQLNTVLRIFSNLGGKCTSSVRIFNFPATILFSILFQLIKRLDIGNIKDQQDPCGDYMASVKDCNLREILAKEILTYDPPQFKPADLSDNYAKLNQLMKVRIACPLPIPIYSSTPAPKNYLLDRYL